jgi:pyridoxal phosphate enzyme (YggS family)
MSDSTLAQRLEAVRERIGSAASNAGRNAKDIELIIVTKNHPATLPINLLDLGETQFGENKDQEASPKAREVELARPGLATWHFVGQLQSNKVRSVLEYASCIHSLDRDSLLKELVKQLAKDPEKRMQVFLELNLTDDPNRGGLDPKDLSRFAEAVLAQPQIQLLGVMGVVGLGVEPAVDFERIAKASTALVAIEPAAKFISAGMSGDYEQAIGFGATHLRIGTAITGNR